MRILRRVNMAKILIEYEVPDGDLCTTIRENRGWPDYDHCFWRSSLYIHENNHVVECTLFNTFLKLDKDQMPFKCEKCLKHHVK
jgi:hypothetical protein